VFLYMTLNVQSCPSSSIRHAEIQLDMGCLEELVTGMYPSPGQSGILTFNIKRALGKDILMEVNQLTDLTPWHNCKSG
jgi:hypothetical protein